MYEIDLTRPQDQVVASPLQRLVRNVMFDKGLTLENVASRGDLSVATIAALRSGDRGKRPRRDTLERLARGLDVPVAEVVAAAARRRDDAREQVALRLFRRLSADEQHLVVERIAIMVAQSSSGAATPAACESGTAASPL